MGRHEARAAILSRDGRLIATFYDENRKDVTLAEVVESLPVDADLKAGLLQAAAANGAGSAPRMVDEVVAKARAARAAEEDRWP